MTKEIFGLNQCAKTMIEREVQEPLVDKMAAIA